MPNSHTWSHKSLDMDTICLAGGVGVPPTRRTNHIAHLMRFRWHTALRITRWDPPRGTDWNFLAITRAQVNVMKLLLISGEHLTGWILNLVNIKHGYRIILCKIPNRIHKLQPNCRIHHTLTCCVIERGRVCVCVVNNCPGELINFGFSSLICPPTADCSMVILGLGRNFNIIIIPRNHCEKLLPPVGWIDGHT